MTPTRILILLAGVAAAVVLFLVLRPGGDDEEAATAPATTATQTTSPDTTATTTETETETEPAGPTSYRVTVRGGRPVGGVQRISARQGDRLRIVVRADVADEVHLHGYDLMVNVAPGAPAQLVFTADITGVFELELEERGLLVAEVAVNP